MKRQQKEIFKVMELYHVMIMDVVNFFYAFVKI